MGIAGRSGVFLGVGDDVASGVGTAGVVDFLTRLPDCAKAVRVHRMSNPAIVTMPLVRKLNAVLSCFIAAIFQSRSEMTPGNYPTLQSRRD